MEGVEVVEEGGGVGGFLGGGELVRWGSVCWLLKRSWIWKICCNVLTGTLSTWIIPLMQGFVSDMVMRLDTRLL